jgi:hypothetical protein
MVDGEISGPSKINLIGLTPPFGNVILADFSLL